jgi:PIN domain nuclease of toxin-antitoxin system
MLLGDSQTRVHVSVVSLWEISIKAGLGKLDYFGIYVDELLKAIEGHGFTILDLDPQEAIGSIALSKTVHKDPFDRMLAWQAISRNLTLVSTDHSMAEFEGFGLRRFEFNDTDYLLNEEIEAYNAMISSDPS